MASCIALKSEGTVPLTIESKGVRVPPIPLKNYAYGCGVRRRERNDATALQAINPWNYVAARVCRLAAGPVGRSKHAIDYMWKIVETIV